MLCENNQRYQLYLTTAQSHGKRQHQHVFFDFLIQAKVFSKSIF